METVHFKRQMLEQWRVTDKDGKRHVGNETAFALMNDLRKDGWKMDEHTSVVDGRLLAVTFTR